MRVVPPLGQRTEQQLVVRLMREHGVSEEEAKAAVIETCRFLALCAAYPEKQFVPSPMVDNGWHAFILFTREYANYCSRLGRFIHHCPWDGDGIEHKETGLDTTSFMEEQGIEFNPGLWAAETKCSTCTYNCNNRCTDEVEARA